MQSRARLNCARVRPGLSWRKCQMCGLTGLLTGAACDTYLQLSIEDLAMTLRLKFNGIGSKIRGTSRDAKSGDREGANRRCRQPHSFYGVIRTRSYGLEIRMFYLYNQLIGKHDTGAAHLRSSAIIFRGISNHSFHPGPKASTIMPNRYAPASPICHAFLP